jgi:hypothetical protein
MRPTNMTAGSVCLWLPRLLPGLGACFDFMGASERLSRRKRTLGVHGLEWGAYMVYCLGFPLQGVHRFKSS